MALSPGALRSFSSSSCAETRFLVICEIFDCEVSSTIAPPIPTSTALSSPPSSAAAFIALEMRTSDGAISLARVMPRRPVVAVTALTLSLNCSAALAVSPSITRPRRTASSRILRMPSPPWFRSGIMSMPALPNSSTANAALVGPSGSLAKVSASFSMAGKAPPRMSTPSERRRLPDLLEASVASTMRCDRPLTPFARDSMDTSESCAAYLNVESSPTAMPSFWPNLFISSCASSVCFTKAANAPIPRPPVKTAIAPFSLAKSPCIPVTRPFSLSKAPLNWSTAEIGKPTPCSSPPMGSGPG